MDAMGWRTTGEAAEFLAVEALPPTLVSKLRMRAGAGHPLPVPGTIAVSDGESLWVLRCSSDGKSWSLFFPRDVPGLEWVSMRA